ncbi:hypothetical protein [Haloferula rosea]|uniref:Uncharacterized protein n=1 Tax=Haloferula rosea TaxID=490093 RepID=A0A934RBK3_9BACT|nr:hypothetical protein [Haloferula rosea]MBK1827530.1 hypothetical protein [Haloferula rosea]
MSTHTLQDVNIDLGTPAETSETPSAKPRRWWNPFQRSDAPRRPWLRRGRALEELRAEHLKLIETIEQLNERISAREDNPSMELDPMPVIRGIESISSGQAKISESLESLNGFMERASASGERLTEAVSQVDQTLVAVQGTHSETVGALGQVSDRMDDVTLRFETLFDRMAESEKSLAEDYRKLQHRTLLSVAAISAAVIVVLSLFMTAPWA